MRFGVLLLLLASFAFAEPALHMARNEKLAEQAVAEIMLKEIYKKAGFDLSVTALPPARANMETLAGRYDGEVARIYAYGTKNPSLIRVEPAYYFLESTAYARKSSRIVIDNKEGLKPYRVGIIRGVQHSMEVTEGLSRVEEVATAEQLFRMLDAGRVDVVIDTKVNGSSELKQLKLQDVVMLKVLARYELFNYLVYKNKDMEPVIGSVIKRLGSTGEMKALMVAAEKSFLSGAANSGAANSEGKDKGLSVTIPPEKTLR